MVKNSSFDFMGAENVSMSLVKVVICEKVYKCLRSTPNKLEKVKHASDSAQCACLSLVHLCKSLLQAAVIMSLQSSTERSFIFKSLHICKKKAVFLPALSPNYTIVYRTTYLTFFKLECVNPYKDLSC